MESKLNQKPNEKPKHKICPAKKQNTWSNLLSKKSVSTDIALTSKKKLQKDTLVHGNNIKAMSKSIQCDLSDTKLIKSSTQLSVFNPIRTLQLLLKEVKGLPDIKSTNIMKIFDEMNMVVEKIINECSENVNCSKLHLPTTNDDSMIPTRENDFCKDLQFENNVLESKYWSVLLGKISELENNYSNLNNNYTKSQEKLQNMTFERDKLLEKYKELCDSLEMSNNRERKYLDTITELKSKLMASEKLIVKQETIILNLNNMLNYLPKRNQMKDFVNQSMSNELQNVHNLVLKENNEVKNNSGTKLNSDNFKITNIFKDNEVFNLKADIKQMKQIVLTDLENTKTVPKTSECNKMKMFAKYNEDSKKYIENNIDIQYTEYNQQASAIKVAKTELQQLFETIKVQINISKELLNSNLVDEEYLSDTSDEDDNCSNASNLMSIVTESSC